MTTKSTNRMSDRGVFENVFTDVFTLSIGIRNSVASARVLLIQGQIMWRAVDGCRRGEDEIPHVKFFHTLETTLFMS